MMRMNLPATLLFCTLSAFGAEHFAGWRGDGTGKYPDAQPPLVWSRVSTAVRALRCSAAKPAGAEDGSAAPDGILREWLIAGPIPLAEQGAPGATTLADEAALDPSAGDKAGDAVWKKVALDSGYLDFHRLLGKPAKVE